MGFGVLTLRPNQSEMSIVARCRGDPGKKNPAVNAVGNSSFELVPKQVGPSSVAFDFQLRPVGGHGVKGPVVFELTVQGLCFDTRA